MCDQSHFQHFFFSIYQSIKFLINNKKKKNISSFSFDNFFPMVYAFPYKGLFEYE